MPPPLAPPAIPKKTRFSRLERLLAQPDIFETLRKIGNGEIKSYEDLDMDATIRQQEKERLQKIAQEKKRVGAAIGSKIDKTAIEEFEKQEA